jgi:anti-sigma-K factor RskA
VARRRSRLLLVVPAAAIVALAGYLALQPGSERHPVRAAPVPAAPPGKGRALASATLRPIGPGVRKAIGAVRVDGRGRRLVLTIAAEHLQAEERSPAQAYTVWLLNSRRDALRLGVIDPPVGAGGSFRSHGTLPPGSRRYHRIVVTLETQLERQPGGPIVLAGGLRIPPAP